jgi:hypothetical protein
MQTQESFLGKKQNNKKLINFLNKFFLSEIFIEFLE